MLIQAAHNSGFTYTQAIERVDLAQAHLAKCVSDSTAADNPETGTSYIGSRSKICIPELVQLARENANTCAPLLLEGDAYVLDHCRCKSDSFRRAAAVTGMILSVDCAMVCYQRT